MGRVAVLLAALVVAVAGCSAGAGQRPSGAPADGVDRADALLFAGDYAGADRTLAELTSGGGSPRAQAHHALLLDYQGRFAEAVAEARAAAQRSKDPEVLAMLTRALDWANSLAAAEQAARAAIGASGATPLVRIFYAEVLADDGRFGEARDQLLAAERQHLDAYQRSELEREWANYYRGKGDGGQERDHVELSLRLQPAFPERQLELIRLDYSAGRADDARALLKQMAARHSSDYWVQLEAAQAALVRHDGDTAQGYFKAALQIRPDGLGAGLGAAEVAMAFNHDPAQAHDLAAAALKANPGSADAAGYVRFLDDLVLKRDGKAELSALGASAAAAAAQGRESTALGALQALRVAAGGSRLGPDAALTQAALAHAYYFLFNFGDPSLNGLGQHAEQGNLPGFSGANGAQRSAHFGFQGQRVSEVISHTYLAEAAVEAWTNTVYHRMGLLQTAAVAAGYGEATVGPLSINVMEIGLGAPVDAAPVVYPYAGESGVPGAFTGGEVPDPLPGAHYPVGYPITLQAGETDTIASGQGSLLDSSGKDVPAGFLPPGQNGLGPNELAIMPARPLAPGAYTVQLRLVVNGQPYDRRWQFTVGPS